PFPRNRRRPLAVLPRTERPDADRLAVAPRRPARPPRPATDLARDPERDPPIAGQRGPDRPPSPLRRALCRLVEPPRGHHAPSRPPAALHPRRGPGDGRRRVPPPLRARRLPVRVDVRRRD